jgi:NTE family protein
VQTVDGPTGSELIMAAADTAGQASVNASYTAFQSIMGDWQRQLSAWRCGLSPELRKRYGAPANWNCHDLKLVVTRVGFDQLGPERAKVLNAVDTRLHLPANQVDAVIAAGRDALGVNPGYVEFLKSVGGRSRQPVPMPQEPLTPAESAPVALFPGFPEISPASSFSAAR